MIPLPPARRSLLAMAALVVLTVATVAQEGKKAEQGTVLAKATIKLSSTADGKGDANLVARPNVPIKVYFFIDHNDAVRTKKYTVELVTPKGVRLAAPRTVEVIKGTPVPLTFDPPAPPKKEAPKKEEPAAKKDEAAPPPPGIPLPLTPEANGNLNFGFVARVKNDPPEENEAPLEIPFSVVVQEPADTYIDRPKVVLTGTAGAKGKGIAATVTATSKTPQVKFDPKVPVSLVFPQQPGIRASELRAGTYSRDLFNSGQSVQLSANNLPLTGKTNTVKFYLNVDGYERAFTYTLSVNRAIDPEATANEIKIDDPDKPVIRVYPIGTAKRDREIAAQVTAGTLAANPIYPTLPVKDLKFRVEVDSAPANSILEFRIDRSGKREFDAEDEKFELGGARDKKVWLETGGEGGVWTVSNTVTDHVRGVDVSALRGERPFQAVLKVPVVEAGKVVRYDDKAKVEYLLHVDDTPPPSDDVDFDYSRFPKRHVKGVPLKVWVRADDQESGVEKVTFYLGKPGPDGVIPKDAPSFVGVRDENPYRRALGLWVGEIQLPAPAPADPKADPKAPPPPAKGVDVTAVAENGVGLGTPKVVRIELVDPKGGTIQATVKRGTYPQANVEVTLRDAEGKEKGVVKTKADGIALFVNLPPGPYRLYAGKPDVSTGLIGNTVVTIPDPPLTTPMKIDLDLAKRR
jgi:hypothetical protein